jgi:hypothetical protein
MAKLDFVEYKKAITVLKPTKAASARLSTLRGNVIPREANGVRPAQPSASAYQQAPVYSCHDSVRHYRALPQPSGVETGGSLHIHWHIQALIAG